MSKKILAMAIILIVSVLFLASCGKKAAETKTGTTTTTEQTQTEQQQTESTITSDIEKDIADSGDIEKELTTDDLTSIDSDIDNVEW